MSRLTIDITDQQHQRIKAMAALQGKPIKKYAIERLFPASPNKESALGKLKALLEQRMADSASGGVLARSLSEIADDAVKAGGSA